MTGRTPLAACCIAATLLSAAAARAQSTPAEAARDAVLDRRTALMIALSAEAGASIVAGTVLLATDPFTAAPSPARNAFRRGYAIVTLLYGVINAGLAAGTLASIPGQRDKPMSLHGVVRERDDSGKVFAYNAALDMIYVMTGATLWRYAPGALARGTGAAIVTQGGFLMLFDSAGSVTMRYGF